SSHLPRLSWCEGMSKRVANVSVRAVADVEDTSASEQLVCAFNGLRDELISTLWFLLGNREDALDAAQEAFLKCWRAQAGLKEVRDLRAWIFRVGLNAARDMQRSAWSRRTRNFRGEETMLTGHEAAPPQAAEKQEALGRLREAIRTLRREE